MAKAERNFIGFLFLVGLVGLLGSLNLTFTNQEGAPGAGLVPILVSIILMILTLGYLISKLVKKDQNAETFFDRKYFSRQVVFVIVLISSIFLINVIGMLVSIGLLIFLCLFVVESKPWKSSLTASIASVIVMYLIFDLWLGLTLPMGYFL